MPTPMIDRLRHRPLGRQRLLRSTLGGLTAIGVAVVLAATAVAAPVGMPVPQPGPITAWGYDGDKQVSDAPTGGGYTAIAAGYFYSLALTADGHITAWGSNGSGQISSAPAGGGYTAIAAGGNHSLALDAHDTTPSGSLSNFGS